MIADKLSQGLLAWLDHLRLRLASPEAILLLSILAVLTGLLTGLVIVLFRFLLEFVQIYLLPSKTPDDYESLHYLYRLALPLGGALLLAVLFQPMLHRYRQVGILHVFERLQYHQGRMPWVNMVMQFFGAGIAILSGHSVGREGPGIHMGAYSGSWVAQRLQLPNNSTRTLVAGGAAAAIGASFNTPLAGIIFAMEVVMQQYSVQGFVPVILAAVSGTYLAQSLLGKESFFEVTLDAVNTSQDWWLAVLLGMGIGVLSAVFNFLLIQITRLSMRYALWQRFVLAGLLMGAIGWQVPASMGIGYDTVNQTLNGQVVMATLTVILLAKLAASVLCLGLGIPGGVIGPLMFMGAAAGGVLVTLSYSSDMTFLIPAEPKLYPLIGMGAMFSASLQAPLAGLTAIMEMAGNADIILPAMLAIVSANLTSKVIFQHDSIFSSLLQARGLDHSSSVVMQRLRMIGAASIMNRSFALCGGSLSRASAQALLSHGPQWLVITDTERQPGEMVRSLDLQGFLETHPQVDSIQLREIPGKRLQLAALSARASLQEALDALNKSGAEALYLHREAGGHIYGVITRERVNKAWL